jgi:hypothetical protein
LLVAERIDKLVLAGQVTAPAFNGTYYGNGANLTGVSASNVAAPNVTAGTFGAGVLLPAVRFWLKSISKRATRSTRSYSNPNRITC